MVERPLLTYDVVACALPEEGLRVNVRRWHMLARSKTVGARNGRLVARWETRAVWPVPLPVHGNTTQREPWAGY